MSTSFDVVFDRGSFDVVSFGADAVAVLTAVDTDTYSQHPVNCYMEKLPQYRHLENIVEKSTKNKIPDKVVLSGEGRTRQLSDNRPSLSEMVKQGLFR